MKNYYLLGSVFIFLFFGCATFAPKASYQFGEIGPGGGIIFYTYTNALGERFFLEVGPVETEKSLSFGKSAFNLKLSNGGGHGSSNTRDLATEFKKAGFDSQSNAILYCDELIFNDLDDWYLPSADELAVIYERLYMDEIGDFKNSIYWSSFHDYRGAHYFNFSNGQQLGTIGYENNYLVRPVRRFKQ